MVNYSNNQSNEAEENKKVKVAAVLGTSSAVPDDSAKLKEDSISNIKEQLEIKGRRELAAFIGISSKYLNRTISLHARSTSYHSFEINKASGSPRILHAVTGRLKTLQRKALDKLQSIVYFRPSGYAHGFTPDKSIISNAAHHSRKKLIVKVDIKDFFPSIHFGRVKGLFMAPPFNFGEDAATAMAQLSCLGDKTGALPQGGVLSPYIANMLCRRLDKKLARLAEKYRASFTRYADDITFSTNRSDIDTSKLIHEVREIVESENFSFNEQKTKVLTSRDRQIVTGIVVNDGLNVNRKYVRNIKATIRNCEINGIKDEVVKNGGFKNDNNSRVRVARDGDAFFWIGGDGEKVSISESDACRLFLEHLTGKLNFLGDVALSNIKDNKKSKKNEFVIRNDAEFERYKRIKIHAVLVTRLYQLVIKEAGKFNNVEKLLVSSGRKNPYLKNMKLITDRNEQVRKLTAEIKSKFNGKYPQPNITKAREVFQSLRDSINGLGVFTHKSYEQDLTFERGMQILSNSYYPNRSFLPRGLRSLFDQYINEYERFAIVDSQKSPFDPYSGRMYEATKELKYNTRYDKDDNSLEKNIASCEEKSRKDNQNKKRIKVIKKIRVEQIYTHVPSINSALERIFDSMLKNTSGSTLIVETSIDEASAMIELSIRDDATLESTFNGEVNGKINGVVSNTAGLCEYVIEALDSSGNRACFDMHKGEKVGLAPRWKDGFVHRLIFDIDDLNGSEKGDTCHLPVRNIATEAKGGLSYRALLLDCRDERRKKLTAVLSGIRFIDLISKKCADRVFMERNKFDIIFLHKNNPEEPYVSKWISQGQPVIFEFSGSFQKEIHRFNKFHFRISEELIRKKPRLEKRLKSALKISEE